MRVAIFDTKHFEVAYNALRFFAAGENRLFMFVTETLYHLFQEVIPDEMDHYQWFIHDRPGEEKKYLDRLRYSLAAEKIDLLWITTIDNNFRKCAEVLSAAKQTRSVMTIHNLNHWMGKYLGNMAIISWYTFLTRKFLLRGLDGLCVLEENLADTLRTKYRYQKSVFMMPGLVYEDVLKETLPEGEPTRFVVPGSIEFKRRDYHLVLDAFEAAFQLDANIMLTLLGAPVGEYGRNILERCDRMRDGGMRIHTFEGFVPQSLFHQQMKQVHMVLAPIQVDTSFSGCREHYSITKSSGTMGDILRYAKPAIVPKALHVSDDLQKQLLRYRNREDFIAQVREMTLDRKRRDRKIKAAQEVAEKHTPDAVYRKISPGLTSLISGKSRRIGPG